MKRLLFVMLVCGTLPAIKGAETDELKKAMFDFAETINSIGGRISGGDQEKEIEEITTQTFLSSKNFFSTSTINPSDYTEEFYIALQYGTNQLVEQFLDAGFDVNSKLSQSGVRPLMHAAEYCNFEVIALLIERNADINAIDSNGVSVEDYADKMNQFFNKAKEFPENAGKFKKALHYLPAATCLGVRYKRFPFDECKQLILKNKLIVKNK